VDGRADLYIVREILRSLKGQGVRRFALGRLYMIRELSVESGLPISTINYYIEEGLLKETYRAPNNFRFFNDRERKKLLRIAELRKQNLSIESIRDLINRRSES
jgi:DNA-binding transcriptional MerR regulator